MTIVDVLAAVGWLIGWALTVRLTYRDWVTEFGRVTDPTDGAMLAFMATGWLVAWPFWLLFRSAGRLLARRGNQ